MDQVLSDRLRETEWQSIVAALNNGLIVVTSGGEIVWMDEKTRRRVNGGLRDLDLPIQKSDESRAGWLMTVANATINGKSSALCVLQEATERTESGGDLIKELEHDLIIAIEAAMAEAPRAIMEKLKALRQAGRPHAHPSDLDLLTQRQREVLALICDGRSNAEMSRMLHLSPNTVRNHIASLFRKIGVNRRSAAIIWARERAITSREALGPRRPPRGRSEDKPSAY